MTQEGKETEGAQPEAGTDEPESKSFEIDGEAFDPERAMRTIRQQRESERELKEALSKYREAEEAELEKQKSLETKLTERDQRISELEGTLTSLVVRHDFELEARQMGYDEDELVLAFMAAKEEDLLGAYNPEDGEVGKHDFETLIERYPKLAPSDEGGGTYERNNRRGEAGVRSTKGNARTPSDQFNQSVRQAILSR